MQIGHCNSFETGLLPLMKLLYNYVGKNHGPEVLGEICNIINLLFNYSCYVCVRARARV
jgi:hypothetical protein